MWLGQESWHQRLRRSMHRLVELELLLINWSLNPTLIYVRLKLLLQAQILCLVCILLLLKLLQLVCLLRNSSAKLKCVISLG